MTNDRGIVANSLPDIDRGTDARAKMSRRRFLAFTMVGIMIVAAITMVMPAIMEKDVSNSDGTVPADTSRWTTQPAANQREAVYTINHLFENYIKNVNGTKAAHGAVARIQEAYLGHHGSVLGQNEWLNTSLGANPRNAYGEMMMRNNYPYIGYWAPAPTGITGVPNPTRQPGLVTWSPYKITGVITNDTVLKTGNQENSRNMPFGPNLNHTLAVLNGGKVNVSLYGTYMTGVEMDDLNAGLHYGNWFYGLPAGVASDSGTNDGYFYEIHGTIVYDWNALNTFLNYTPGISSQDVRGGRYGIDNVNPVTWFNSHLTDLTRTFRTWMWENFSQYPFFKGGDAAYWNNQVYNGNIFTVYEFDMIGGAELNSAIRLDPQTNPTMWNFSGTYSGGRQQLAIRVYWEGWGPDCAMFRMMQQAGLGGVVGTVGAGATKAADGYWANRGAMLNYGEDVNINSKIARSRSNTTFSQVTVSNMLGWEDDGDSVWSGGWMINLGNAPDYIPNVIGSQDSYNSPMNKYRLNAMPAADAALDSVTWGGTGTRERTTFWNAPGALRFHTNATISYGSPQARNLSAYEAIIVDLNINTRASGQAMALQPYQSTLATAGASKTGEYARWSYWGTLKLGQGCYPQTQILAGYNANTKILNLTGTTAGINTAPTWNADWWGGRAGQTDRIYTRGAPIIQLDVSAVDSYNVTVGGPEPRSVSTAYWVKVTPLNKTGVIPRNTAGRLIVNSSVTLGFSNSAGTTFASGVTLAFNNVTWVNGTASTTVTFGTINLSPTTNVTALDTQFSSFAVGVGSQAPKGASGHFTVVAIPEFATILVPIVGMMAIFFVFRTVKKRKREE